MNAATQSDDKALDVQLDAYTRRASRRGGRKIGAQLLGYTAAAGGLAFAGGDAMGAIVHFNTPVGVGWNAATATTTSFNVATWDINGNGSAEAVLYAGVTSTSYLFASAVPADFIGGGVVFFVPEADGASSYPANLPTSRDIVDLGSFVSVTYNYFASSNSVSGFGGFLNTTGYAGFVFGDATDNGPLFGWAKIGVEIDFTGPPSVVMTIHEWAYEDSGAPIHIADRVSAVPSPATPMLTLLGLGTLGLQAYRRRREAGLKRLAADAQDKIQGD